MKISYGLLMYKIKNQRLYVFIAHPGGPYFKNKDIGFWTIPKGEALENEDGLYAAQREFWEETGIKPIPPFLDIGSVKQKGGKTIRVWAFENNLEVKEFISNHFNIEWPPHSGKYQSFPEIDKADFYPLTEAIEKINPAQVEFLKKLEKKLKEDGYLSLV